MNFILWGLVLTFGLSKLTEGKTNIDGLSSFAIYQPDKDIPIIELNERLFVPFVVKYQLPSDASPEGLAKHLRRYVQRVLKNRNGQEPHITKSHLEPKKFYKTSNSSILFSSRGTFNGSGGKKEFLSVSRRGSPDLFTSPGHVSSDSELVMGIPVELTPELNETAQDNQMSMVKSRQITKPTFGIQEQNLWNKRKKTLGANNRIELFKIENEGFELIGGKYKDNRKDKVIFGSENKIDINALIEKDHQNNMEKENKTKPKDNFVLWQIPGFFNKIDPKPINFNVSRRTLFNINQNDNRIIKDKGEAHYNVDLVPKDTNQHHQRSTESIMINLEEKHNTPNQWKSKPRDENMRKPWRKTSHTHSVSLWKMDNPDIIPWKPKTTNIDTAGDLVPNISVGRNNASKISDAENINTKSTIPLTSNFINSEKRTRTSPIHYTTIQQHNGIDGKQPRRKSKQSVLNNRKTADFPQSLPHPITGKILTRNIIPPPVVKQTDDQETLIGNIIPPPVVKQTDDQETLIRNILPPPVVKLSDNQETLIRNILPPPVVKQTDDQETFIGNILPPPVVKLSDNQETFIRNILPPPVVKQTDDHNLPSNVGMTILNRDAHKKIVNVVTTTKDENVDDFWSNLLNSSNNGKRTEILNIGKRERMPEIVVKGVTNDSFNPPYISHRRNDNRISRKINKSNSGKKESNTNVLAQTIQNEILPNGRFLHGRKQEEEIPSILETNQSESKLSREPPSKSKEQSLNGKESEKRVYNPMLKRRKDIVAKLGTNDLGGKIKELQQNGNAFKNEMESQITERLPQLPKENTTPFFNVGSNDIPTGNSLPQKPKVETAPSFNFDAKPIDTNPKETFLTLNEKPFKDETSVNQEANRQTDRIDVTSDAILPKSHQQDKELTRVMNTNENKKRISKILNGRKKITTKESKIEERVYNPILKSRKDIIAKYGVLKGRLSEGTNDLKKQNEEIQASSDRSTNFSKNAMNSNTTDIRDRSLQLPVENATPYLSVNENKLTGNTVKTKETVSNLNDERVEYDTAVKSEVLKQTSRADITSETSLLHNQKHDKENTGITNNTDNKKQHSKENKKGSRRRKRIKDTDTKTDMNDEQKQNDTTVNPEVKLKQKIRIRPIRNKKRKTSREPQYTTLKINDDSGNRNSDQMLFGIMGSNDKSSDTPLEKRKEMKQLERQQNGDIATSVSIPKQQASPVDVSNYTPDPNKSKINQEEINIISEHHIKGDDIAGQTTVNTIKSIDSELGALSSKKTFDDVNVNTYEKLQQDIHKPPNSVPGSLSGKDHHDSSISKAIRSVNKESKKRKRRKKSKTLNNASSSIKQSPPIDVKSKGYSEHTSVITTNNNVIIKREQLKQVSVNVDDVPMATTTQAEKPHSATVQTRVIISEDPTGEKFNDEQSYSPTIIERAKTVGNGRKRLSDIMMGIKPDAIVDDSGKNNRIGEINRSELLNEKEGRYKSENIPETQIQQNGRPNTPIDTQTRVSSSRETAFISKIIKNSQTTHDNHVNRRTDNKRDDPTMPPIVVMSVADDYKTDGLATSVSGTSPGEHPPFQPISWNNDEYGKPSMSVSSSVEYPSFQNYRQSAYENDPRLMHSNDYPQSHRENQRKSVNENEPQHVQIDDNNRQHGQAESRRLIAPKTQERNILPERTLDEVSDYYDYYSESSEYIHDDSGDSDHRRFESVSQEVHQRERYEKDIGKSRGTNTEQDHYDDYGSSGYINDYDSNEMPSHSQNGQSHSTQVSRAGQVNNKAPVPRAAKRTPYYSYEYESADYSEDYDTDEHRSRPANPAFPPSLDHRHDNVEYSYEYEDSSDHVTNNDYQYDYNDFSDSHDNDYSHLSYTTRTHPTARLQTVGRRRGGLIYPSSPYDRNFYVDANRQYGYGNPLGSHTLTNMPRARYLSYVSSYQPHSAPQYDNEYSDYMDNDNYPSSKFIQNNYLRLGLNTQLDRHRTDKQRRRHRQNTQLNRRGANRQLSRSRSNTQLKKHGQNTHSRRRGSNSQRSRRQQASVSEYDYYEYDSTSAISTEESSEYSDEYSDEYYYVKPIGGHSADKASLLLAPRSRNIHDQYVNHRKGRSPTQLSYSEINNEWRKCDCILWKKVRPQRDN